jgi:hypothetical protein
MLMAHYAQLEITNIGEEALIAARGAIDARGLAVAQHAFVEVKQRARIVG